MIVRGIVSEDEFQQIKSATKQHRQTLGEPGNFHKWVEDGAIWVEIDVHQDVMSYLKQSGFFDGMQETKTNRKEKACMHE